MKQVYLGLGGNIGQVLIRLQQAIKLLSSQSGIEHLMISRFYRSAPFQVDSPLWFVNVVCTFQTLLTPKEIFNITQEIEIKLGKVSKPKNASRPIDIDILFYGDQIYLENDLEIPHPRWKERLFVLMPLSDLTDQVVLQDVNEMKKYILQDLIQPLLTQSIQSIYVLDNNLDFQVS